MKGFIATAILLLALAEQAHNMPYNGATDAKHEVQQQTLVASQQTKHPL